MYTLKLNNPRERIASAHITVMSPTHAVLRVRWDFQLGDIDYVYRGEVAAKRAYAAQYQSKKYGHSKPIWSTL